MLHERDEKSRNEFPSNEFLSKVFLKAFSQRKKTQQEENKVIRISLVKNDWEMAFFLVFVKEA